jgi:hypothetical protein
LNTLKKEKAPTNKFQNSFSKEILALRPPKMIDRFMTAVFMTTIAAEL